jgi:serpin B
MTLLSRLAAFTGTVALAAGAAGCAAGAPVPSPVPSAHLPALPATLTVRQAATLRDDGRADTAFGMDVLGAVCRSQPGANLVLSPASLASGLGMAYLGARGATATAMSGVLHLPATPASALVAGLRTRAELLGSLNRPGVTLTVSDRIWADPSVVTNSGYLARLLAGYGARMAHVPLLAKPESARQTINATVAADTAGHIGALMPPGSLNQVGWVLTDALYLKAAWLTPFDPAQTQPGPFTTQAGRRVTARYLHGSYFRYATSGGWTAVQLPYRGGRLAMLALLPPAGGGCHPPPGATLAILSGRLGPRYPGPAALASVALPKIDLSTSESMNDVLKAMGMGVAFTAAADFTGLSAQACCIGLVQHAATLQVGEKGTVASAATGITLLPTAARPATGPEVVFNRPYLLLVEDTRTGEPLMLARVTDPAAR